MLAFLPALLQADGLPLLCAQSTFIAGIADYIQTANGWSRIALVACSDVYCQGLRRGVEDLLAESGINVAPSLNLTVDVEFEKSAATHYINSLIAGFAEDCETGGPDVGPPIVILLAHGASTLLEAAQQQDFRPIWLASEGIGSDLGVYRDVYEAEDPTIFLVRVVPPVPTRRGRELYQHLGGTTDQFVPMA